jgi:hypothetical protein
MMRRYRRPTVQLTSLLDLLFVMIFLSLLQTKNPPAPTEDKPATPVTEAKPPAPITEKVAAPTAPAPEKPAKITVNAIFHFYSTPRNQQVPTGTFAMNGTFNQQNGQLELGGVSWINRPEHYDMIPLKGKIDAAGATFTGRIEFQDCEEFTLKRTSKISGSSIAGKWEGKYICSQGETGLTLTLQ